MHAGFRNRLTFFFILLVILPASAVAVVGIAILREGAADWDDPALAQSQRAARGLHEAARERAAVVAGVLGGDRALGEAVRDRDRARVRARLTALAEREGAARVRIALAGGEPVDVGAGGAIAPADSRIVDAGGQPAGRMTVSVATADELADEVSRVTGHGVAVRRGSRVLAGTVEAPLPGKLPLEGTAEIGGDSYRVASFSAPGFDGQRDAVFLLASTERADDRISSGTLGLGLILLAFLVCALAFALTAARSLQAQIERLLDAARHIGRGDFSVQIPTEGDDGFAALGHEFNSMARQLESRLQDLQLERSRLQETVRRVGESLGKGLDRDALLGIVVQTAVDGVGAQCGRVVMRADGNGTLTEAARAGDVPTFHAVLRAAEEEALRAGEAAETRIDEANALARALISPNADEALLGVISIARPGPFSERQRELFTYLTSQASISIENVGLHETIQRQAVTDELTGLFNHRRFQEVMAAEVERARRFGQDLGLIMLDIDDFKRVNDTYGHLQGDAVLRAVAGVLRESSREIDEPARYGGEEMAVALPQTDLEGAYEFAERVRGRIEALQIRLADGEGILRITASFGVASLPHSARLDKDALVAAADAALYRAKRSGKNCTVKAE